MRRLHFSAGRVLPQLPGFGAIDGAGEDQIRKCRRFMFLNLFSIFKQARHHGSFAETPESIALVEEASPRVSLCEYCGELTGGTQKCACRLEAAKIHCSYCTKNFATNSQLRRSGAELIDFVSFVFAVTRPPLTRRNRGTDASCAHSRTTTSAPSTTTCERSTKSVANSSSALDI